jgi:hypothetical protein
MARLTPCHGTGRHLVYVDYILEYKNFNGTLKGSVRVVWVAGGVALLSAPFEGEPGYIAELNGPGDDVGGYEELVVENRSFIHSLFPFC